MCLFRYPKISLLFFYAHVIITCDDDGRTVRETWKETK